LKRLRSVGWFAVTAFVVAFALAFLSADLEARGERPIPQWTRWMIIVGVCGVVSTIVRVREANRGMTRAAAAEESEAKRFTPVAEQAVAYVFRDSYVRILVGLDVLVDGAPIGRTLGKTFYRIPLAPGEHVLASRDPKNGSQHEHRLSAHAGAIVFLEQRLDYGLTGLRHELVPIEAASATRRIRRCRLLMPAQ
jgi:hypothetical protein